MMLSTPEQKAWESRFIARFVTVAIEQAQASFEAGKDNYDFARDNPEEMADEEMGYAAD